MNFKPAQCVPCPLVGDMRGHVVDELRENAAVLVVGQGPGGDEEAGRELVGYEGRSRVYAEGTSVPRPFLGPTGYHMIHHFFPCAGLTRETVSLANVIRCRWQKDGKRTDLFPPSKLGQQASENCMNNYFRVPPGTKLIVAVGQEAWTALGGEGKIGAVRGTLGQYRGIPVLATLHAAALLRDATMELPTRKDWSRVPQFLAGQWPRPLPQRKINPTAEEIAQFFVGATAAPYIIVDTEYNKHTKHLALFGADYPGSQWGIQFWWMRGDINHKSRSSLVYHYRSFVRSGTVVFQNALADVPVLRQAWGINWSNYARIEDTMQLHSQLYSPWPHDLDFLLTLYSDYDPATRAGDLETRNWGDVCHTMMVWQGLVQEAQKHEAIWNLYRGHNMRILPAIEQAMQTGIAVDEPEVKRMIPVYEARKSEAEKLAHAYCGWPVNVGSEDQLKVVLYSLEGIPVRKHPKSKRPTTDKDAIAEMRQEYIDIDPDDPPTIEQALENIEDGGHSLLESAHVYAKAGHMLSAYLNPLITERISGSDDA